MKDFRSLKVWEKGHQLVLAVYKATGPFPKEELYGITGQIRRSCISIPSNIAEGCGKNTPTDFSRFLQIAFSSASELEYQLLLSRDLGFLNDTDYESLSNQVIEVKQMLSGLIKTLKV
jgi:four helix bundle protein